MITTRDDTVVVVVSMIIMREYLHIVNDGARLAESLVQRQRVSLASRPLMLDSRCSQMTSVDKYPLHRTLTSGQASGQLQSRRPNGAVSWEHDSPVLIFTEKNMIPSQNHYNAIPCSSSCIGAYHNACTIYCDSVTAQYCMPLCHIRHAGLPFHTESYTILPYTILTYIMGPFIEILSYHTPSYLYTMYHLKYNIIPYTFMLSTPFLIYTILS